jgi:hypothetical protein
MPNGRIKLSSRQLHAWHEVDRLVPGWALQSRLISQYAHDRGGLTLAFWRLRRGPIFGQDTVLSIERCAQELRVPVSDLVKIATDTQAWVRPRLERDRRWRELRRTLGSPEAERHLLKRIQRESRGEP